MPKTHFKSAHRVLTVQRTKTGDKPDISIAGSGAAGMKDATVRMKKITGGGSALAQLGDEGKRVEIATLQALEATDHTHGGASGDLRTSVPLLLEKQAIAEVIGGASPRHVEVKYELSAGFVTHALKRRFGSPEAAKTALLGLVGEVGMACMVKGLQEIPNMSGPQAVMSGAIAIDKMLSLEKSIADKPKVIDFAALADMAKTLKVLREIATPSDEALARKRAQH